MTRTIQGTILVLETGAGVPSLTVAAYARGTTGKRSRIGSVATDDAGRYVLAYGDKGDPDVGHDVELEVVVDGPKATVLYTDPKPREKAGATETWTIRLPLADLVAAGVLGKNQSGRSAAAIAELPALGTLFARAAADDSYEAEIQTVVRARLDRRRESAEATITQFQEDLLRSGRGDVPFPSNSAITSQVSQTIGQGLTRPAVQRARRAFASVTADERRLVEQAAETGGGMIPAHLIEPMLYGPDVAGERTTVNLLDTACRFPRLLADACREPATPTPIVPAAPDVHSDIAEAVWRELRGPSPLPQPDRPNAADVWRRVEGLNLTTGPADAPALFDFHAMHLPFEDVWRDLVDDDVIETAAQLHAEVNRLGGRATGGGTAELRREARFLAREAPPAMKQPRRFAGSLFEALGIVTGVPDPFAVEGTRWVSALLEELERKLHEPYRFTVYGADQTGTAINFGMVTTYRQVWQPLSYQAGKLVNTITLAPREERAYARKVTEIAKRRTETKERFRSIRRTEDQATQRAVRDIVETAEHKTGLEASGSYGVVSGSLTVSDERKSSDTRNSFRESVRKAATEYETDRSLDIVFETSREVVSEESGKLSNPNDELAVTFLFYQLQRRYRVFERLHRVTPVVLVAQPVPKPNQINITWILQHDWILRRVLLDPSFASALDVVTGSLVGEEATVGMLRTNLEQQRQVVTELKNSLAAAHKNSDVLFQAVQGAIRAQAGTPSSDWFDATVDATVGVLANKVLGWITGADNDDQRGARLEAAREAMDRAARQESNLVEQLQQDQTTLTLLTDKWAAGTRALLDKTVDVQRLRLHIKQNILYYMQAIWDHEPPDQRYFRLHKVKVPVIAGSLGYRLVDADQDSIPPLPPTWTRPIVVEATIDAHLTGETVPLAEVADLNRPLGYKGNYAIFPMREPNLVSRFMMLPYVDRASGAHDPDHLGNLTRSELEEYYCCLKRNLTPDEMSGITPGLEEAHRRLLTDPRPLEEVIVVPTDALFIEALPADQPILEPYKLRHRAADAVKAEAEATKARLENVRRSARILAGELGDPDVEKLIIVQGAANVVVPADDN